MFDVKYGVNLELVNCEIVPQNDPDGVNFVARTGENNGVVARVKRIADIAPQPAGTLSCAGGGSVLSTFIQTEPYYSGRDLYVLTSKKEMSLNEKLFWCTCISHNSFRFSYGRQANKSIPNIEIPDIVPEWVDAVCSAPIYTKNICCGSPLDIVAWKEFEVQDVFNLHQGNGFELINMQTNKNGEINFVSRTAEDNGVVATVLEHVDCKPFPAGMLTVSLGGSVLSAFVQDKPFYTAFHVMVLESKTPTSVYAKLFCCAEIEANKYRYSYGRQANKTLKNLILKLPIKADQTPDWDYMENYIKSLPYSDRISAE